MRVGKTRTIAVIAVFISALSVGVNNIRAADEWNPKKTWVFFVGLVRWKDAESFEPLSEMTRKDSVFLDSLRKRGVPEEHIASYKDEEATTAKIEADFPEFLRRAAPDDWLIVYFEGHAYKKRGRTSFLATYDVAGKIPGWKFDAIPNMIERNFSGSQAIIALDTCFSGAIRNSVEKAQQRVSYAIFASSLPSELSPNDWTFTEALISAFDGASYTDINGDGKITLAELGERGDEDMLFFEGQRASITYAGRFDPQTVVATAPARSSPRIGERVEAHSTHGWQKGFIEDYKDGKFRVHYYRSEPEDDEWVVGNMIRKPKIVRYSVGERVEVRSGKNTWILGIIVQAKDGKYFITFPALGHENDQWVMSRGLRQIE